MTKLTNSQLVILAAAARREDCAILPLPRKLKLAGDATATVFEDLLKKKLIAEQPGSSEAAAWRDGENGERMMLVATTAGLRAIGAAPANQGTSTPKAAKKAQRDSNRKAPRSRMSRPAGRSRGSAADTGPAVRPGTKQAKVIDLLRRPQGASIAELIKATDWQRHSVRGIIAGALKKKLGIAITAERTEDGERRYRIGA